ncbi:uncharacterized protein LOC106163575 [Lingula anatina]|uniref:Uncharacterized protein LOC106163575 n=1 Tax=Lingula anatina TaxID=7574 RepID=A0A1S3IEH8_LINAN|nr:uncharacterized protein LOC106163575 [Lingula anatina]|eukprot:XP_013396665.1 uncharacterized protein LOC106163575 [Lingula anatina]
MATSVQERFTFFWRKQSPFSQWHSSEFEVDGVSFNCAEQYMMYRKAVLFGDETTAKKILDTVDPAKQKALGRKVHNFNDKVWKANCWDIVKTGNLAKFSNPKLREVLLATRGTILVEASPVDTIWGIGLAADSERANNRSTWRGKNLLGYILTEVRAELLKEDGQEDEVWDQIKDTIKRH